MTTSDHSTPNQWSPLPSHASWVISTRSVAPLSCISVSYSGQLNLQRKTFHIPPPARGADRPWHATPARGHEWTCARTRAGVGGLLWAARGGAEQAKTARQAPLRPWLNSIVNLYGFNKLLPNAVSRAIRAHRDRSGRSIAQSASVKSPRPARPLKTHLWS